MAAKNPKGKKGNQKNNKSTTASKDVESKSNVDKTILAAHEQADKDIEQDADLKIHSHNNDLDEGESARLGDGKNELV